MLSVNIKVFGAEELERKLSRMKPAVQKKLVEQSILKSAHIVRKAARMNLRKYRRSGIHTDRLIAYYNRAGAMKKIRRNPSGRFGYRVIFPPRAEAGIPAGDRWYWPAHMELGTAKTPAHPYLRDALNKNKSVILAMIKSELGRRIEKELTRA